VVKFYSDRLSGCLSARLRRWRSVVTSGHLVGATLKLAQAQLSLNFNGTIVGISIKLCQSFILIGPLVVCLQGCGGGDLELLLATNSKLAPMSFNFGRTFIGISIKL